MRPKVAYRKVVNVLLMLLVALVFTKCVPGNRERNKSKNPLLVISNLERIHETGTLKAVVDYNSTNYFVYRGKPMGFQYELLNELCEDLDVNLEIVVLNNLVETFEGLQTGRFDLVAKNLTITGPRSEQVDFTFPLDQTHQVLVQRIQKDPEDSVYVNSALELAGKRIYVQKKSSYYRRLVNLEEEIGMEIDIVEDSIYGVEQLISRVAKGEIDYTVCDDNVAKLNKSYYPNLDVSLEVSFPQNIAWAVKKGSDEWKSYLDNWIENFKNTRKYRLLYYKYFESPRSVSRIKSDYNSLTGGKISKYDKIVKELAEKHNWDWRLISAVIYHESRFNEKANSWAGAYGLMQLMPITADRFGIKDYLNPRQNIEGGIRFLNWLDKQFLESVPDSLERIKFVIASYNIGLGHVMDAQRLAEKYGRRTDIWDDNVDFFLLNKSSDIYYTDPVVRFGYCRGEEAFNHVKRVIGSYEHYKNVIEE